MPLRYQRGHLRCVKRNSGNFLWRESLGGRRTAVKGSIDEYPTEELAQGALNCPCDLIFHDIGLHETAIVRILEFRSQCHF